MKTGLNCSPSVNRTSSTVLVIHELLSDNNIDCMHIPCYIIIIIELDSVNQPVKDVYYVYILCNLNVFINVSCLSVPYGNRGCGGGSRESSIMYAIDFGIDTSSSYPYIARVR